MSFAAIDVAIDKIICSPAPKKGSGEYLIWGDDNRYPYYIKGLCDDVPTLHSCVTGLTDFVTGDDVHSTGGLGGKVDSYNRFGDTSYDIVHTTSAAAARLGVIAWKITRNVFGQVVEIEPVRPEYLRTDEDNEVFYYCEDWHKPKSHEYIVYPRFVPGVNADPAHRASILYIKLWGDGPYPEPLFAAAVKACETERSIDDFHLGNIMRGFMGSYIINLNNGVIPTDDEKAQFEREFTRKYSGKQNAGRVMFMWNRSIANKTTLEKMEVSDYGEKYETLSKHCRQQIFTAFRANPNLFGINTENNGFSDEDFEKSFKLFNRCVVKPIQRAILNAFEYVTEQYGAVTIVPFTLAGSETTVK